VFTLRQNVGEIPTESPPTGAPNQGGVGSNWWFSTNISQIAISQKRCKVVTMEH